jgi:hypothetical protein
VYIITLDRLTSPDTTGETFSAGWMKGMEMCSQLLAWGMLREDQGGHQASNGDVVAYYQALPNEAGTEPVTFDADGSYQYTAPGPHGRLAGVHADRADDPALAAQRPGRRQRTRQRPARR